MAMRDSGIFSAISDEVSSIFSGQHLKTVVWTASAVLVVLGSLWAYRSYVTYQEKSAHLVYAQLTDQLLKARENKDAKWDEIAASCKKGYEAHKSSSVALYLLAFEAEALP